MSIPRSLIPLRPCARLPAHVHDLETITLPHPMEEFTSIIDVRTPSEYAEDHLPGAINLPVLSDAQRVEVGTLYKQDQFAARALGARYISANISDHLAVISEQWPRQQQPLLYCWRGGLRSRSFALILRSIGWRARLIEGGYKSYRRHVLEDLKAQAARPELEFHVLAGLTGTGKTRLLHHLREQGADVLDLEGLANHRGSLLGARGPQPSQKYFESQLHTELTAFDGNSPVFVEAESNRIGNVSIPPPLWQKLASARVTEIQLPLPERAQLLQEDYPQFIERPAELSSLLDELRRLRGHEQVDRWQEQIARQDWPAFLASILRDHYDLAYRRAGSEKSNYQKPSSTLPLDDAGPDSFARAARELITINQRPPS
ncbi:MAG: tRNA 2-selenouridine(34) synthase MnmH [Verrucomicrobiota bacterium JB023]|nr:tRNA 2-selenouridine(34) synthase MnmH [Verrucomicrobiota bacterium JB023]